MEPRGRPGLPELLGWIPIIFTLGVLALVLYRITFVSTRSPAIRSAGIVTPTAQVSDPSRASAPEPATTPTVMPGASATSAGPAASGPTPASTPEAVAPVSPAPTAETLAARTAQPSETPRVSRVLTAVVAPSAGATPSGSEAPDWTGSYVVQRGDTLSAIASKYNVSVLDMQQRNHIEQANRIMTGQKLVVPAKP